MKWSQWHSQNLNVIGSHLRNDKMVKTTNGTSEQMEQLQLALKDANVVDDQIAIMEQMKKLRASIAIESENAEMIIRDSIKNEIASALEPFVERINGLVSVKMVSMSIDKENGVVVNLKTKSSSGGNGGGGVGVGMVKDGEWFKLGTIWENHATPNDIAEYNAETSGTKKWNIRKRVAKLNGYTIAK